jgi:hypothetical protein
MNTKAVNQNIRKIKYRSGYSIMKQVMIKMMHTEGKDISKAGMEGVSLNPDYQARSTWDVSSRQIQAATVRPDWDVSSRQIQAATVRPDVRVYNYALTAQQIKSLYNNNSAVQFSQ